MNNRQNMKKLSLFGMKTLATLLILILTILLGTSIGEVSIPFKVILLALENKLLGAGHELNLIDQGIIWNYRLSRSITAASCGAGLAICGVVLQSLLRNPLADPYIIGISAGASTGAVLIAIVGIGGGALSMTLGAFVGAVLAFALIMLLARTAGGSSEASLGSKVILAGIAGSQLFNALTSLIITKTANAEQARGIMFWLLGNMSGIRWEDVGYSVAVAIIGISVCYWQARSLDAFIFGSESAASLGIDVKRVQFILIGCAALITAVIVSLVGSIGFVGLVIPHAARFLVGSRHLNLIPASALIGAVFLVIADIVSRIVIPGQILPIGVVTALVGAPAFALILLRGQKTI